MFLFDILIYVMFAWVMCWFAKTANNYGEGSLGSKYYIWYFMLFFAVICGIRYNVGVDCLSYIHNFKTGYIGKSRLEESLWVLFVQSIHRAGIHYTVGMGLVAFVQIYFLVRALKGSYYILAALPIVLFGSSFFWDMTNGMRQVTAACIFTFASRFIIERKPIPFFLSLFLASLIHHSALMVMPLFVFAYIPPKIIEITKYRNICVCLLFACLFLGMTPILQGFVTYIESLTNIFGYDDYTQRIATIAGSGYTKEARAFGPMQLSYFLIALAVTWFGPLLKERYEGEVKYFNLWYFFAFIYGCGYFLICNTSHLFIRIVMFLEFYQLIIASMLLVCFWQLGNKYKQYAHIFIIAMWMATCWNVFKNYGDSRDVVTYKVFLFHDK